MTFLTASFELVSLLTQSSHVAAILFSINKSDEKKYIELIDSKQSLWIAKVY